MEKKILVVRIAEGLGNQLFMFANSFFIAKAKKFTLMIDNESGYFKNKNQRRKRKFLLNFFNIKNQICHDDLKFKNYYTDIIRKFLKIIDLFNKKKKFLIENKDKNKKTKYLNILKTPLNNLVYVEGHFESEKYFIKVKKNLQKILTIKKEFIDQDNKYINLIKKNTSVSLHIRRHKFSEDLNEIKKKSNIERSIFFTNELIKYNHKGIEYFRNKLNKPIFFIWSNDFTGIEKYFNYNDCIFVKNNNVIMDFYLLSICKHFIVGGSTFHWMGAWLNENKNKICLRPRSINLNPSNNINFWPEGWLKI